MMSYRIRYDAPPVLVVQMPQCGACEVDLDCDPDSMVCPLCGTSWSTDASDGATGDLPEAEGVAGLPVSTHDEGGDIAALIVRKERRAYLAKLGLIR